MVGEATIVRVLTFDFGSPEPAGLHAADVIPVRVPEAKGNLHVSTSTGPQGFNVITHCNSQKIQATFILYDKKNVFTSFNLK